MRTASKAIKSRALLITWGCLRTLSAGCVATAALIGLGIVGRVLIGMWNGGLQGVPEPDLGAIKMLGAFVLAAAVSGLGRVAIEDAMEEDLPDRTP